MGFPATTGLQVSTDLHDKPGIEAKVLVSSAKQTWSANTDPEGRHPPLPGTGASVAQYQDEFMLEKDPEHLESQKAFIGPVPLVVLLRGKLPSPFEGKPAPPWAKR